MDIFYKDIRSNRRIKELILLDRRGCG